MMQSQRLSHSYQQDYFQRVRKRTYAIQAMAPLALLVAALADAALTGRPLLTHACAVALPAGIAVMLVLMLALTRVRSIALHGWITIAMLCTLELSLAYIVTPALIPVLWLLPILLVVPVAAAPFWVHYSRMLACCVLCYACGAVALRRAGFDASALTLYLGLATLFTCTGLAVFLSIDRLRRNAYRFQVNLDYEAKHDALTGLLSRRRFLQLGEQAARDAREREAPYSLCFLDLDYFKDINDQHGHAAGDQALSRVAETMVSLKPPDALVARMGGEEFVMLLPGFDAAGARDFANALRKAVKARDMGGFTLTLSAGVAQHMDDENLSQTLHRADSALLDAKQAGRDRVVVAPY